MNEELDEDVGEDVLYSVEELKSLSAEEANQLPDRSFKRWQELKREKLREQGQENMDEIRGRNSEVLDAFSKGTEDELTKEVEVYGQDLEILLDLSNNQIDLLREIDSLSKGDLSDLDSSKADGIAEKLVTLLSNICVTNGGAVSEDPGRRRFWELFYEKTGSVLRLYKLAENILLKWKELQDKTKSFRS